MRPAAATRPAAIGMTSAVVLPTSSISASGCSARDGERARHPVGGGDVERARPRLGDGDELARRRERKQPPAAQRGLGGVEHEARRPRAWCGTRRRAPRSSSAPRASTGRSRRARRRPSRSDARSSASRSRQTSNGRETTRRCVAVAPDRLRVGAADVEADHAAHAATLPGHARDPGHRSQGRRRRARGARRARTLPPAAQPRSPRARTRSSVTRAVRDALGPRRALRRRPRRDRRAARAPASSSPRWPARRG